MFKKIKAGTTLFLTCLFALGWIGFFSITYQHEKMKIGERVIDTAYHFPDKPVASHIDSLPYYRYSEIRDSLDKIEDITKSRNTLQPAQSIGFGFIGFTRTTSYWYDWFGDHKSHLDSNFYVSIPNYQLHPSYRFIYRDHKYYLNKKYSDTTEIGIGYLPARKTLLVPVSEHKFKILSGFSWFLLLVIGFAGIYVYIILPIVVLINISAGNVFTKKNIRKLYILAYTSLGFVLIQLLMPYVIGILFMKKIPGVFVISFYDVFMNQGLMLLVGTILLAIASAFAKGYKLQQDQDLTI